MQELLREMKRVVDRYKENSKEELSVYYNKKFSEAYDRITKLGEEENPIQDGQKKRGKARCLLDRFIAYEVEICRFTEDFDVPFDNNQAERDLRSSKVKKNVSGGFRTEEGAKNFAKISSVIGTALKQGVSAFTVVSGIVSGSITSIFFSQKFPVTE